MDNSWSDAVQRLTEKLSVDNLPHQVRSCRGLEQKMEKVLSNISVCKKISGWLSASGEAKYGKSGATADRIREQVGDEEEKEKKIMVDVSGKHKVRVWRQHGSTEALHGECYLRPRGSGAGLGSG